MVECNLKFPHEIKEMDPEVKAELCRLYQIDKGIDFVNVGPKGYKLLRSYTEEAENIYNLPLRPSDVFVITYQRSGTTWAQELVWLIANNFDYARAAEVSLLDRYTFIEFFMFYKNEAWINKILQSANDKEAAQMLIDKMCRAGPEVLPNVPSPRFIKTHLPLSLLPPKLLDTTKVVYVARDPRDVAVSSYHHARLFKELAFSGPFKDFWTLFSKNLFVLTPVFEHVKEAWEMRNHPNMLFLFYEEFIKDLPKVVRRVADFLNKDITEEQVERLCDHLNIKNFKKNVSVNFEDLRDSGILAPTEQFIRKGKAGGWREYFDEEMSQQAEKWIEDNLKNIDLRFPSL